VRVDEARLLPLLETLGGLLLHLNLSKREILGCVIECRLCPCLGLTLTTVLNVVLLKYWLKRSLSSDASNARLLWRHHDLGEVSPMSPKLRRLLDRCFECAACTRGVPVHADLRFLPLLRKSRRSVSLPLDVDLGGHVDRETGHHVWQHWRWLWLVGREPCIRKLRLSESRSSF